MIFKNTECEYLFCQILKVHAVMRLGGGFQFSVIQNATLSGFFKSIVLFSSSASAVMISLSHVRLSILRMSLHRVSVFWK